MPSPQQTLFHLLRLALGFPAGEAVDLSAFKRSDWDKLVDMAFEQGVAALVVDALQKADTNALLESEELEDLRYELFGEALACEEDYGKYRRAIVSLADFYHRQGIRMMVLKGYGLGLNYPNPSHRPVGDIDIYLTSSGQDSLPAWQRADRLVEQELGIKVDRSHEHHTVFQFEGFTVENHYDIVNTKERRSSIGLDSALKRLAGEVRGESLELREGFYLPSADFNAIFVIRHMGQHIAGERVTLRQLLDWGLLIDRHSEEIDWGFVSGYWSEIGIREFARCINTICVERLGIAAERFHGELSGNEALCTRLLDDILSPEFKGVCPQGPFLKEALFKTRRYIANGWKRKLVYKEGLLHSFVAGAVSKWRRRGMGDKTV